MVVQWGVFTSHTQAGNTMHFGERFVASTFVNMLVEILDEKQTFWDLCPFEVSRNIPIFVTHLSATGGLKQTLQSDVTVRRAGWVGGGGLYLDAPFKNF